MTWLFMNIPLMVVFVALFAGVPTWLVLKRPDRKPEPAAAAAVRTLPAVRYERERGDYRRVA